MSEINVDSPIRNVDSPIRAAYELWRAAFYEKNISTTPAYDVVGLLAALCRGRRRSHLTYFEESNVGSNLNVKQEGATVYKLRPEYRTKERLAELFENLADFGAANVKLGIVTDFGEECDDEVACLLAARLPRAGLADVRFLFTTKLERFELQKQKFVQWAYGSEENDAASKARQQEYATMVYSIHQKNNFIDFLNEGGDDIKRIILQIGPIHEPETKPSESGWQSKNIWRPNITCKYDYITVGTFNGVPALNVKANARVSALHLMSKAQNKIVIDTMAGHGAFKFSSKALTIIFPEVSTDDRSSIIEHVCKIGWRNSVGRASAVGGKWVAHLVSEPVGSFEGGANYMTMKKIQEELGGNVSRSCGSIQLANKYLDQLQDLGGLQVARDSTTNNTNGATSISIVNGYSYILDCLHHFFKVPVQFFESGRPEHWLSQWLTPSNDDSPADPDRFHINEQYNFKPVRCRSPPIEEVNNDTEEATDEEGEEGEEAKGEEAASETAFITGIPAKSIISGVGEYTRGITLCIRQKHVPGLPSLSGSYKLAIGSETATNLLSEHMPVESPILKVMTQALASSKQFNFDVLREKILEQIGVETNADLLNYHLFHPSQWKVEVFKQ